VPAQTFPLRLGVMADPGMTLNTTIVLDRLILEAPDLVALIGDFCYAGECCLGLCCVMEPGSAACVPCGPVAVAAQGLLAPPHAKRGLRELLDASTVAAPPLAAPQMPGRTGTPA
jgi:hypothetical protein